MNTPPNPAVTDWMIRTTVGFQSGRVTGYTVERIYNPYSSNAYAEPLERGKKFSTEAEARAAIARATQE